jgi:Bacterial TSP3 repeat
MHKPSKKILVLLSICIAVLVGIVINKYYFTNTGNTLTNIKAEGVDGQNGVNSIKDVTIIDTDGDGLPDWQEILHGTDVRKPDTDGDGTSDNDEVVSSRDPLISGPDDIKIQNSNATSTDSGDAKTVSEAISRKLFSSTVYLSDTGVLTDSAQQSLITDVMKDLQDSFRFKKYPIEGLTYIETETPETLRFYGDIFASLQIKMVLDMNKKINKIQKDFNVLADIYQKQADNLFTIKVPRNIADKHIEIVNNFSRSASVYRAIANEKEDPLVLPLAVKTYEQALVDQANLMSGIADYLQVRGIIYTKDEAGDYWNSFY